MISVVVPAYNAGETLADCLQALQNQSISPDNYEIIVVDDGSTDCTTNIAHRFEVTVLTQLNQGAAAARNAGAKAAHGDLLLFTDADCVPSYNWIEILSSPFMDARVMGVKGAYRTRQREVIARFVQIEYEDKYDRTARLDQIDFIDTYSAAYRRDNFLLNDGFDPRLRELEDQEFSFRLAHKGYRLVFMPAAVVYHRHNSTLRAYFKRKFEIGYWKSLLAKWHPDKVVRDSHTPQVEKIQIGLVAFMLSYLPIAIFTGDSFWVEGLIISFFVLSTVPFVIKATRKDLAVGVLSPALLWIRSLALGFGLLAGLYGHAKPSSTSQPALSGIQRMLKRTLDLIVGSLTFVCCLPIWAVIALLIKLDSHGPVFFVQKRVGENGRTFDIYKFRTMVEGADKLKNYQVLDESLGSAITKLPNDPRCTRVGTLLRRASLDEMPNLINVLRGEMSLVGPRPEEVMVVELYNDWHRRRLAVKPGMTGPMQINGRATLSLDERVKLELDYIQNYSLTTDIAILVKTIPAVVKGRGAF
jgi:lipopolysaccharide/colanic/teichoic acid biosynthesis glycosyltransferase/glycosyltransferase involved in cell wall biosynthesis